MKTKTTLTISTTILLSLMILGMVTIAGVFALNPNLSATNSAYAVQSSTYGTNLINPAYESPCYLMNNQYRTGFTAGPAPDRADIVWRSADNPALGSVTAGLVAFNGHIFFGNTVNGIAYLTCADALTGTEIWTYKLPQVPGTGGVGQPPSQSLGFTNSFGANDLFKLDEHTIGARVSALGFAVWDADTGALLWVDPTIQPNAPYHPGAMVYDANGNAIEYVGPMVPPGYPTGYPYAVPAPVPGDIPAAEGAYQLKAWSFANPRVAMANGSRLMWFYNLDQGGRPQMCVGGGLDFLGSWAGYRVSAYNLTTGALVWATERQDACGYAGAYDQGMLFVGCESQHMTCYNATTGAIIWQNDMGVANRAFNVWSVDVAYGRVYFHDLGAGTTGALKCLDEYTGQMLWSSGTYESIGYYQCVIGDGKIYGQSSDGSITTGRTSHGIEWDCWDAFTGAKIWSMANSIAWPVLAYGCLYINVGGGAGITDLQCISTAVPPANWIEWRGNTALPGVAKSAGPLDLSDGPAWMTKLGGAITSSAAVANGKVYVNCYDQNTYCLDAYTGAILWKFPHNQPNMTMMFSNPLYIDTSIAPSGHMVVIGPDDGTCYALDANSGAVIWSVPMDAAGYRSISISSGNGAQPRCSPLLYSNKIYVGSFCDNTTYCLDLSGHILWRFQTGGPIVASYAISNGVVYVPTWGSYNGVTAYGQYGTGNQNGASDNQTIYEFDATSGAIIRMIGIQSEISPSPGAGVFIGNNPISNTPVVIGNRIYYGIEDGYLVCYDINGTQIYTTYQPYVLGENQLNSLLYVPDSYIICQGQNTTQYLPGYGVAGQLRSPQQAGPISTSGGKIFSGVGPTVAAMRADNGSNIWSAWGGWEVWSSTVFSGGGSSALIYAGSESYAMTVYNASGGQPLSWFTTGGDCPASAAIYDGNLYFGSADNYMYCFSDSTKSPMAITETLSSTQLALGDSLTVSTLLGGIAHDPFGNPITAGVPNQTVLVTFTRPDGSEVNVSATTGNLGTASMTYTPDVAGSWSAIAWYNGNVQPTEYWSNAFSPTATFTVGSSATATPTQTSSPSSTSTPSSVTTPTPVVSTPTPTGSTKGTDYTVYIYAIIAVIVIIIIVVAALMLMRRKK